MLNKHYIIDVDLFVELGHKLGVGEAHPNLGSWFDSRKKAKCKSAHSTDTPSTSKYQHGGTGIIRGPITYYAKH